MRKSKASLNLSEVALTLLQSVGRRSDAEFYLRLFRDLPAHRFAMVAPDPSTLSVAEGTVAEHLRFLAALGLFAPVAVGLFEPDPDAGARLLGRLQALGLRCRAYTDRESNLATRLREDLSAGKLPVIQFAPPEDGGAGDGTRRFQWLGELLGKVGSRKLVLVRSEGGLGPRSAGPLALSSTHTLPATELGLSVINLRRDHAALRSSHVLDAGELELVDRIAVTLATAEAQRQARGLVDGGRSDPLGVSITAPANLLHELFTVKGAGTLVRPGSVIEVHTSYDDLDTERLIRLLETSFGKKLDSAFFERAPKRIYLEQEYRGAAIIHGARQADYLTKFAVDRVAQGLGIGRDLWDEVIAHHPKLFWRARPGNPISSWYDSQCDGCFTEAGWTVYVRGISVGSLPALVRDALSRPEDFRRSSLQ